MLGAPASGYGGYASPEGLADSHGMGYGDTAGGMGGGYNSFMRGLLDAYAKLYGGNSSLLGHNRSVFGGPMISGGPVDIQGSVPTDENPGGFVGSGIGLDHTFPAPGYVNSIPTPAFVDLTDPNLQDPMGGGVGGTPAGGYSFGGMTPGVPTDANPDGGGGERPWWLPAVKDMGMMNPATGGWNDWDAPYTGTWPPSNKPPTLPKHELGIINYPMGYTRPKRPNLAYGNAYDNAFIGGDDM